ncbi:MAG: PadR family transcriptional regulator [Akkermansiaceae bacterium]|nr:PadR family transcriptional regulator [Armatimonadota bacterium]
MSTTYRLTTPDLVLLGLLSEKPRHGYEINAELARRNVEDWAGVSRPQVYYSLKKLAGLGMIAATAQAREKGVRSAERQVYAVTTEGLTALREGLTREEWATEQSLPPFLTWLALAPYATQEAAQKVIELRESVLRAEIAREEEHLIVIRDHPAAAARMGELMVTHKIAQWRAELAWLASVQEKLLPVH